MELTALLKKEGPKDDLDAANDNVANKTEFDGGSISGHLYHIFPVSFKYLDKRLQHYGMGHTLNIALYNLLASIKRDAIVKIRTQDRFAFPEHRLIYADGMVKTIHQWGTSGSMPYPQELTERLEEEARMMKALVSRAREPILPYSSQAIFVDKTASNNFFACLDDAGVGYAAWQPKRILEYIKQKTI